ncbi:transporter substrate-binding domain-containing protein [Lacrimispora algidixylanolytica]|nr:transporter substrate-binding domain-containing protein [Lacrimispora algidixylanolytica]
MKKMIPILLVAAAVALCGCSKSTLSNPVNKESITEKSANVEHRKVRIATGGTGEPYSLLSSDGKDWTGIDAEMWSEISKRTGWEIEFKQAEFSSLFGELDAGRIDVAANCFATTKARMEKYITSHPYYGDAQCVIVNEDQSDINTLEELKGITIGVTQGQASQVSVEKLADTYQWNVVVYETSDTGYQDLYLKRINAMATTDSLVHKYEKSQNMKFHILDNRLLANNVAYYFQQNDKGQELCNEVNQVLDEMMKDGTTSKIITKWMYSDMTKMIRD